MTKIFHPLLALIASATDKELAKYVEYLKHENKLLRSRLPRQVHTSHEERQTLLSYGKAIGRAIEELITIVSPATFYNWVRNEKNGKLTIERGSHVEPTSDGQWTADLSPMSGPVLGPFRCRSDALSNASWCALMDVVQDALSN